VQLVSKISNQCDHKSPTSQTDGQTDDMRSQDRALQYKVHILRGKNEKWSCKSGLWERSCFICCTMITYEGWYNTRHIHFYRAIPSFQLGTVTLAGWLVGGKSCLFVHAINRPTSGCPNALTFCCCRKPARWENQTSVQLGPARTRSRVIHFSAKRGLGIACRPSVCLSVCDVGDL